MHIVLKVQKLLPYLHELPVSWDCLSSRDKKKWIRIKVALLSVCVETEQHYRRNKYRKVTLLKRQVEVSENWNLNYWSYSKIKDRKNILQIDARAEGDVAEHGGCREASSTRPVRLNHMRIEDWVGPDRRIDISPHYRNNLACLCSLLLRSLAIFRSKREMRNLKRRENECNEPVPRCEEWSCRGIQSSTSPSCQTRVDLVLVPNSARKPSSARRLNKVMVTTDVVPF